MVPLPKVPPRAHEIVEPCRQCGHDMSLKMNGATTRSPTATVGDVGADVFDDADELVADRADRVLGLAPVVPEVRTAHARHHDTDDRVGRVLDTRVGSLADLDRSRTVEDRCSHHISSTSTRLVARDHTQPPIAAAWETASRGVLAGTPTRPRSRRSVSAMDNKDGIREFLASRRAKITPEQAGLPVYGTNRRVKGPAPRGSRDARRDQRRVLHPPRARQHPRRLRRRARRHRPRPATRRGRTRPPVRPRPRRHDHQRASTSTDTGTGPPERATDPRLDHRARPTCATNASTSSPPTGSARPSTRRSSTSRRVRSTPHGSCSSARSAPEFFVDWDTIAHDAVAILRAAAGRDPYDKRLTDLIGELSTRSDEFRVRWAAHNVKFHRTGTKRFHHPVVGDLTLNFEALELAADPGQRLNVYTAEPGSPSHDALNLLASWITTPTDATTGGEH